MGRGIVGRDRHRAAQQRDGLVVFVRVNQLIGAGSQAVCGLALGRDGRPVERDENQRNASRAQGHRTMIAMQPATSWELLSGC